VIRSGADVWPLFETARMGTDAYVWLITLVGAALLLVFA
jgi:hypothetical protein